MTNDFNMRRRLRLGALLYRLHYYAVLDSRDAEGQITRYRLDALHSVHVIGSDVQLVRDAVVEDLTLEAAIARCQAALDGQPLHRPLDDGA